MPLKGLACQAKALCVDQGFNMCLKGLACQPKAMCVDQRFNMCLSKALHVEQRL